MPGPLNAIYRVCENSRYIASHRSATPCFLRMPDPACARSRSSRVSGVLRGPSQMQETPGVLRIQVQWTIAFRAAHSCIWDSPRWQAGRKGARALDAGVDIDAASRFSVVTRLREKRPGRTREAGIPGGLVDTGHCAAGRHDIQNPPPLRRTGVADSEPDRRQRVPLLPCGCPGQAAEDPAVARARPRPARHRRGARGAERRRGCPAHPPVLAAAGETQARPPGSCGGNHDQENGES